MRLIRVASRVQRLLDESPGVGQAGGRAPCPIAWGHGALRPWQYGAAVGLRDYGAVVGLWDYGAVVGLWGYGTIVRLWGY